MQRGAIFGGSLLGAIDVIAVGLVDRDHVGEFDDAFLDALQFVAGARQHQREKEIRHVGDGGFRLPDANGLDQNDIEARSLAQQHRLACLRCDAAERTRRRRGTNEGVRIDGKLCHARLVAQNRAAGARRRRIDRQNRDLVALGSEPGAERVDGGRFADARRAGDADAQRLAGIGEEFLHELSRRELMVRPAALDQGNGARQHCAFAGADARGDVGNFGVRDVAHRHGRIAKARAGNPRPSLTFGHVTTISAPFVGTLSRFAITSIW